MTLPERRIYENDKYYHNPKYIIDRKIRTFFKDAIRKNTKTSKYEKLLGYTIEDFREHFENLFINGMNWTNYGEWEICLC